jgi:transposase
MATKGDVVMVQALSNDIRKRVIEDVLGGMSRRGAARKYRVSASFVITLMRRYEESGSYKPLERGGDRRSYLNDHSDFIAALIEDNNAVTLIEIQARLQEAMGRIVHISILDRFIRRMGFRYKKNGTRIRTGS